MFGLGLAVEHIGQLTAMNQFVGVLKPGVGPVGVKRHHPRPLAERFLYRARFRGAADHGQSEFAVDWREPFLIVPYQASRTSEIPRLYLSPAGGEAQAECSQSERAVHLDSTVEMLRGGCKSCLPEMRLTDQVLLDRW